MTNEEGGIDIEFRFYSSSIASPRRARSGSA